MSTWFLIWYSIGFLLWLMISVIEWNEGNEVFLPSFILVSFLGPIILVPIIIEYHPWLTKLLTIRGRKK